MRPLLDDLNYKKRWNDFSVEDYEGYSPNMSRYHTHSYFEISLIVQGNVTVILGNTADSVKSSGTDCRILLIRPHTPHFITPEPDALYTRRNILFSMDFLTDCSPEWRTLLGAFGKNSRMIHPDEKTMEKCLALTDAMKAEADPIRRKLLLLYFLSLVGDDQNGDLGTEVPSFINEALHYISVHYPEKITAASLAETVGVGRTTLMTGVRHYTGTTLCEYLTRCRLRSAINCLKEGMTEQEAAEICGFGSTCYLIRVFRKQFGTTPVEYLKTGKKEQLKMEN